MFIYFIMYLESKVPKFPIIIDIYDVLHLCEFVRWK